MGFGEEERNRVREQAAKDAVVFLHNWKKTVRKWRVYRICLYAALFLSCTGFLGYGYYLMDSNIPSVIYVKADREQSFQLGVPAKGEILSAGAQGDSNIPGGAVTIDLSSPVTLKTGGVEEYSMNVKLFGFLPIKQVGIQVIEDQELIPVGVPVGIYMESDGIMVVGTGEFTGQDGVQYAPAKYILHSGDYIRKLNGKEVTDKEDFISQIEKCDGETQILTVKRGETVVDLRVKPVRDLSGAYKIGVWVRDSAQGVGTMTYIDSRGRFGALGHGISDVDTSSLLMMEEGTLYRTRIISIQKGTSGNPGEMTGMIVYSDENILGEIDYNGGEGIFGTCNQSALDMAVQEPLPIGLKQEIQRGKAQILCTVDGEAKYYAVEITDLHLDHDNINRGIELRVTDPELLAVTGGIVQGMFTGYNWCKDRGKPVFTRVSKCLHL